MLEKFPAVFSKKKSFAFSTHASFSTAWRFRQLENLRNSRDVKNDKTEENTAGESKGAVTSDIEAEHNIIKFVTLEIMNMLENNTFKHCVENNHTLVVFEDNNIFLKLFKFLREI